MRMLYFVRCLIRRRVAPSAFLSIRSRSGYRENCFLGNGSRVSLRTDRVSSSSRRASGKLSGQRTTRSRDPLDADVLSLNIDATQSRSRVIRIAYLRDVRERVCRARRHARAERVQQPADAENAGDSSSGYSKPALMSLRDRVT